MEFEWAYSWVFYLVPFPIIIYWVLPPLHKREKALKSPLYFRAIETTKAQKAAWISQRKTWAWISLVVAWIGILATLASPQMANPPEKVVKISRNFMIAADISFSMDRKDWVVDNERLSRWEAVKLVMKDFVVRRPSDRIGLIFFGTNAYLQSPFTNDLEMIKWQLDQTEVGMAGQMTGIGNALGLAMDLFSRDTIQDKVMILLTDGVDDGKGINPLDAAVIAAEDSITLYTLGIGTPGNTGSDLDEATLIKMAELTGGQYFRAMDKTQLDSIYKTLDVLEPIEYEEDAYRPVKLLYVYPLMFTITWSMVFLFLLSIGNFIKSRKS